jgi:ribonuclease HII
MFEEGHTKTPVKRKSPAPDLTKELELWRTGFQFVGGIDEAGRGCWAGPVFSAVVVFSPGKPPVSLLENVRDSKQMSAKQRQKWAGLIKNCCLDWGVGSSTNNEIDTLGIVPATRLAARRALDQLKTQPDFLLLDYLKIEELKTPQLAMVRGDERVLSIAAASILAKTSRDSYMIEMDSIYPVYWFKTNKGYGTAAHRRALKQNGICPIHRLSFKPIMAVTGFTDKKAIA